MTREQLLKHLLHQARSGGFELRRWFHTDAALPWPGGDAAVQWLSQGRRIHLLLFSQAFAQAFFSGEDGLRHIQPATTYQRTAPNGVTRTVHRRAHIRNARSTGAWCYHLQRMATAPEPLPYARRFLISAETVRSTRNPSPPPTPRPHVSYDDELLVDDEAASTDPAA